MVHYSLLSSTNANNLHTSPWLKRRESFYGLESYIWFSTCTRHTYLRRRYRRRWAVRADQITKISWVSLETSQTKSIQLQNEDHHQLFKWEHVRHSGRYVRRIFPVRLKKKDNVLNVQENIGNFQKFMMHFWIWVVFEISIGLIRYLWNVDNLIGRYLGVIWAAIIMGTGFGMKIIKLFNPKTLFKKQCCHFHQ